MCHITLCIVKKFHFILTWLVHRSIVVSLLQLKTINMSMNLELLNPRNL